MRVRFKADAAVMTDHGPLALTLMEATVEPAPDGRYAFVIPEGPAAGETVYVDAESIESFLD